MTVQLGSISIDSLNVAPPRFALIPHRTRDADRLPLPERFHTLRTPLTFFALAEQPANNSADD